MVPLDREAMLREVMSQDRNHAAATEKIWHYGERVYRYNRYGRRRDGSWEPVQELVLASRIMRMRPRLDFATIAVVIGKSPRLVDAICRKYRIN